QSDSVMETLEQVRERPPTPPSKVNRKVPRDLEVICLKCLEKDPRRRYASADAVAEDLKRYLAGEPILARRTGSLERAVKWARRQRAIAASLGLTVTIAALGFAAVTVQWLRAERARRAETDARRAEAQANETLAGANTTLRRNLYYSTIALAASEI